MTREEYNAAVEARFNPRIAQRQDAYDQYNALVARRDEKIREGAEYFDRLDEIARIQQTLPPEPADGE